MRVPYTSNVTNWMSLGSGMDAALCLMAPRGWRDARVHAPMDLLEYQGKQLFAKHGVPVPSGKPAKTVDEAVAAAAAVGYPCVVKAQVLIGGRGKAGGIKLANDEGEAREHATAILGMDIKGFTV